MEATKERIILPDCEPIARYSEITANRWHELRRTGIGGSDSGAILGYSKYVTPLSVWMQKTGRMQPQDDGEFAEMGKLLEPFIRRELLPDYLDKHTEYEDVTVHDPEQMYRSKDHPFVIVNIDGLISLPCYDLPIGLEIKTGTSYQLKDWGGVDGDEVPDMYYCQVQHCMAVTGLQEWWVFGVIGNRRLLRIVPRNDDFIAELIDKEKEFWGLVKINDPLYAPLPVGSSADMDALMALGTPQRDDTVDISGIEKQVELYEQLRVEIQGLQEQRERVKQEIILALDKCKYGQTDNYLVTFSRFIRNPIDTKKLKKDYPELVELYSRESESGRLTVKGR